LSPSAQRPLTDLLAALSARSPAPGAGSGTAWAASVAAALLEMTATFAGDDARAGRAAALQRELIDCGERELHSYAPVLEANRLASDDPARASRLADALSQASETPLAIARHCAEVAELAEAVVRQSKPALTGDAAAAVLLAEACTQAAARLVEINLREGPAVEEASELARRAASARDRVLNTPL
jgi:methenyltetrahydrofolate cyclohydrolase